MNGSSIEWLHVVLITKCLPTISNLCLFQPNILLYEVIFKGLSLDMNGLMYFVQYDAHVNVSVLFHISL